MKRLVFLMAVILACTVGIGAAEAKKGHHSKPTPVVQEVDNTHNVAGVKVDAPNLVRVTENTTIGVEAGKDLATDIGYNDFDWNEADKGYFGYVKVTWSGNLFDFTKKKETVVTE